MAKIDIIRTQQHLLCFVVISPTFVILPFTCYFTKDLFLILYQKKAYLLLSLKSGCVM